MQQAQQLGRYHLLDRIAFGGMAEIYRAKTADAQGRLHLMAVKRVLSHLIEDEEFIQMLTDEARVTALLKHPNIARVYEFCKTKNEYFIAMEYVDGKDLRALLEKAKQAQEFIPEEHLAYIGMMTAWALHAAHTQTDRFGQPLGIVHRDVSPSNVLVSYQGEVKLCDFGIAKAEGARSQTKTGVIKGKVKYMSPEQAMGRKLDGRSDLFSLGSLLYEMLTLQAPFVAHTEIELLFAVRDARKRPIRELRPKLNGAFERIIEKAMMKEAKWRFEDGVVFADSLRDFMREYYPGYSPAQLAQYMAAVFGREREKELRALDDYYITSGNVEAVGENLLADVLGPNAEYTQFTAAVPQAAPSDLGLGMTGPNPLRQMRVMSAMSMGEEVDEVDEFEPPTAQRHRVAQEIGLLDAEPQVETNPRLVAPSEVTAPRQVSSSAQTAPPAYDGGNETAILHRPQPVRPQAFREPSAEPTFVVEDQGLPDGSDGDGIHGQQTHIMSRAAVDALIAQRLGRKGPAAQPPVRNSAPLLPAAVPSQPELAPGQLSHDSELHAASTQILNMAALPAHVQELLAKKGIGGLPPPAQKPVSPPARVLVPSLNLQPLESDEQDILTEQLDWAPMEPVTHSELSAQDPSVVLRGKGSRVAPSSPGVPTSLPNLPTIPARSATGGYAPISTPRTPTGAQPPVPVPPSVPPPSASPRRSPTSAQPPIAPPARTSGSAHAPVAPTPTPSGVPALRASQSGPAKPVSRPFVDAASSAPGQDSSPGTPPIAARSNPPPVAARSNPPPPVSSPPPLRASLPPAPTQSEIMPSVITVLGEENEEWESLPHLDSTMMAKAGQFPVRPPVRPTAAQPRLPLRDLPTLPPEDMLGFDELDVTDRRPPVAPPPVEERAGRGKAPPPPIVAPPVEPKTDPHAHVPEGIFDSPDGDSFEEDTDKGGGPAGFGAGEASVDPGPYLTAPKPDPALSPAPVSAPPLPAPPALPRPSSAAAARQAILESLRRPPPRQKVSMLPGACSEATRCIFGSYPLHLQ